MKATFKINCSEIHQIMVSSRTKDPLSKTTQSYLERWAKEQIYARRERIVTKYTIKGNMCEYASIEFVSKELFGGALLLKNMDRYENDFMKGYPDLVLDDRVIDVKNSWDCFTFPLFDHDVDKSYYWQVQGYMELTGKSHAQVIYTLMDTPEILVDKEVRYNPDNEEEIRDFHSYQNVPTKYKIKVFDIYRNDEDIENIKQKVVECQKFIDNL